MKGLVSPKVPDSRRRNSWLSRLLSFFNNAYLFLRFVASEAGQEYGIGRWQKLKLATRVIQTNKRRIKSLTPWQKHLILIDEIFRMPKSLEGVVVECGCYNGASTASLSLACALTNRKLICCDSFEGLPEPRSDEAIAICGDSTRYYHWQRGEFSSEGGLEGVRRTVEQFGKIQVCQFVKGYFQDTLPGLEHQPVVLVFEDADLSSSVEDCLRYLWPKLQFGCRFYCDEAFSADVVSLFYDKNWWWTTFKARPPGFYGSGGGIVAGLYYIGMGYATKVDQHKLKEHGEQIVHLGSSGFNG